MSLQIGETFAGYRILRLLGSGGMGQVYLVKHPRLPRQDALKVLRPDASSDPSFRERFIREADLAAGLRHPHIVGVHDRGEHDGQLWIAMDSAPANFSLTASNSTTEHWSRTWDKSRWSCRETRWIVAFQRATIGHEA